MHASSEFVSRLAVREDLPELRRLMDLAIRKIIGQYFDEPLVRASFEIMGVDSQLVEDGTYFVIEDEGRVVGCGGWSRRATMFGGDHSNGRDARLLDPSTEPGRIRAMYTHPDFARRGIGRLIVDLCEKAAYDEGFRRMELVGTVAGEPLYIACGYRVVKRLDVPTSTGLTVPNALMEKELVFEPPID